MRKVLVTKQVGGATVGVFIPLSNFEGAYYAEWDKRIDRETAYYEKSLKALDVGMKTGSWKLWEKVNGESVRGI